MKGLTINTTVETVKKVTINELSIKLNAEQWQLYSDMSGAELCAHRLNRSLESMIKKGKTRKEIEDHMSEVFSKNGEWGAGDSEPESVLQDILDKVFHEEQ